MDVCTKKMRARGSIEFWGYPGSGKSTVVAELRKKGYLQRKNLSIVAKMSIVTSAINNRRALVALLAYLQWKLSVKADPLIGNLRRSSLRSIALNSEPEGFVLEEGVIHELWRCLYRMPDWVSQKWWQKYLVLACSTTVILDVSPGCAWERIRQKTNRGPINNQLLKSRPGEKYWLNAEAAYKAIRNELTSKHGGRMIIVDSEELSIDETCAEILGRLSAGRVNEEPYPSM